MVRDRLTTDKRKIFARECPTLMSMNKDELRMLYNEIFDRLQEYEVAVETGQIIVPPCKVGDFVYAKFSGTNEIESYVINKVSHNGSNYFDFDAHLENEDGYVVDILEFDFVDIGITVFLAKEEAEQALSKLQASYEQVKGGAE